MSSILVFCASCGRQVPSTETENRLCLDCRVTRSVEDLRDEHTRLWRKRERYRRQGANTDSLERQMHRVEARMSDRIRGMVSSDEKATELFKKELESTRNAHYEIRR